MQPKYLQRTLLVGLGDMGAKAADCLLAELHHLFGRTGLVQGLAVPAQELPLENIEMPLVIEPAAAFETWQPEFEARLETNLHQISQVKHLARLAQQGLSLHHPDEIHIIVLTNLAETRGANDLVAITETLRAAVDRTLNCYVGLSAVLFWVNPTGTDVSESDRPGDRSEARQSPETWPGLPPTAQFDRGCFVAGLTNETGLIMGDGDDLIRRSVYFLTVLMQAGLGWDDNGEVGWDTPVTTFGLATIRWPGAELANVLSKRWAGALLQQVLTPARAGPATRDLGQQARTAAQQWLTAEKLAPPLFMEQLTGPMPALPHHLAELVPDLPWPWLLVETQARIENAAQGWQEGWLTACRERLKPALMEWETGWSMQAELWLEQQVTSNQAGSVLVAQSHMAAVSELLHAFVEGVEHNLAEAQADLANLEQRLSQVAESLATEVTPLPASPLTMLLRWGGRPRRWLSNWAQCRRAQGLARTYAHLSRGRLTALQTVWVYEEILPFYRRLLEMWQQVVITWDTVCKQVIKAAQSSTLPAWEAELKEILAASTGPWTEALVTTLYHEAREQQADQVWEKVGSLNQWVAEALDGSEIPDRFLSQTHQVLLPALAIPVDRVLVRQLPDEKAQADWLAGLMEQARPFWRYDETTLAESSRGQVHLITWLLLPAGDASPLAHLGQSLTRSPLLLASRRPEEMGVVTMRRVSRADVEGSRADEDTG